ncbi:MAG: glycosyltransferase family 39 protein, partial [Gemmatimonadaceae bacterium]|nr:glycosyltransferase family 39 protein [Gemmatimonadaceae bacterium]
MVVAVVLRAWGLGRTNLWFDEVNSWEVVRLSWPAMLANLRLSPVGPLYFVLLKPWQLVFGDSERALRSLSLVAGVLVVPVTYAIGVRTLSRRAAAWGAVLVALSPLHLYLSQEARMYMLLTLVAGLTVLAYAHWRDAIAAPSVGGRGAGGALVAYALAAAALLLTNVVAGPLLLALNL